MPRVLLFTRIKTRWFYALAPYKAGEAIFSILFPLFLFDGLHIPIGMVGLLTALTSLTAVPGSMLWGTLSDARHRRRLYMVIGCVGNALCLAGMGVAWTLPQMVVLCLVYGVFSIATAPISSVLIMETMPSSRWVASFGTFHKITGWGWVGGLAVGAGLLPLLYNWLPRLLAMRAVLLLLAVLSLLSAWWAHRTIPEPVRRVPRQQFIAATGHLPALTLIERALYLPRRLLFVMQPAHLLRLGEFVQPPLRLYLLVTVAIFVSSNLVFTPFPMFVQNVLHLPTAYLFMLALLRMLVSTLCFEWAGRWTHQVTSQRAQTWSLMLRSLALMGFGGLWAMAQPALVLGSLVSLNIIAGVTWSVIAVSGPALVGALAAPQHKGEAMGIYNATQGVSRIVGAALCGYLIEWQGYYVMFALAGLLLLCAAGLLASLRFTQQTT